MSEEFIKGHHVLREAGALLWHRRRDFRIVATTERLRDAAPFEEFIGWQSQADLPLAMAHADVIAAPAIAQEAIGRTAVEGMAAGRPVVASRIGGLPFALDDGAAGLLFAPGDSADLANRLGQLLDDAELRLFECEALAPAFGLEALYALYRVRIDVFKATPPAPGWNGVYVAIDK